MARKRYQGKINDKERSKLKLINAVGTVIQTKGYTGLTATNIAEAAGMSRRAISLYFGTVDNLIEIYVKGKDYWVAAAGNAPTLAEEIGGKGTKELLETLLLNQFRYFYDNEEMQKIVLWQISERTEIMYDVCEEREKLSKAFFALSDKELDGKDVDLRAIAALLVGGIYYLVLHAKATDSLFCEIDINEPDGFKRIQKAVSHVLNCAYGDLSHSPPVD
ncbi:TetR/AcrR family transcriptional regulator [Parapedobacter tibetensis]|uniref:TetR/AcrR family transcriptional regulator n=1 Tax=Parapedobacter tibetensis TaxID=2972951 RepID=UPI00214D3D22|nr:TetR/AcrR family transcriptional regulator [Parapedobacter tibetensis]